MLENVTRIVGPPGTGKTTTAMNIISKNSQKKIAFVSYTRAAVNSATSRLDFKIYKDAYHFATLHSLCSKMLMIGKEDILTEKDISEFAAAMNIAKDKIDVFLNIYDFQRNSVISDKHMNMLVIDLERYKKLREEYEKFKKEKDKYDYTDIILHTLKKGIAPAVELLIIDEAQDLTKLQWLMVQNWISKIKEVIIIGDDDQSIYSHIGAYPDFFINLNPGYHRDLAISFRLPKSVYRFSKNLIEKNKNRLQKSFEPHTKSKEGKIIAADLYSAVDYAYKNNKSLFILYRNRANFVEAERLLMNLLLPFSYLSDDDSLQPLFLLYKDAVEGVPLTKSELLQLIKALNINEELKRAVLHELRSYKDEEIPVSEVVEQFINYLKIPLYKLFPYVDLNTLKYYEYILQRYKRYQIENSPIKIGTIHSSKGLEADCVYLSLKQTKRTFIQSDIEIERRIFYVGLTRAKDIVFLSINNGRRYFSV